jgi:hypothetical protein
MLEELCGFSFQSSSRVACEKFIFQDLRKKHGYGSVKECFDDRVNHRQEWFQAICDFNRADPAKLAKILLQDNDIYCGMRSLKEFQSSKGLFDTSIWVDASERHPLEPSNSNEMTLELADLVVDNNSDLESLRRKLTEICKENKWI